MASFKYTFNSGDTLTPARLNDARDVFDIVNADIKSDAAIAGTKISPNFGSQNVVTTGSIGAGTSSPSQVFHGFASGAGSGVVGRFERSNGADIHYLDIAVNPDANAVKLSSTGSSNGSIVLGTAAVDAVTILNSGNVAIGKTSAVAKLDVQGTATTDSVTNISQLNGVQINGNLASASSTGLGFQGGGGGGAGIVFSRDNSFGTAIAFSTNPQATTTAGALTERMRIDSAGNVGIGTTSPSQKLDVDGIINTSEALSVDGVQVVSNRRTGWAAATGTATRTSFATSTVTTAQLAERVKALIDDLSSHGLIGT